jgi:hypothetical protein
MVFPEVGTESDGGRVGQRVNGEKSEVKSEK